MASVSCMVNLWQNLQDFICTVLKKSPMLEISGRANLCVLSGLLVKSGKNPLRYP